MNKIKEALNNFELTSLNLKIIAIIFMVLNHVCIAITSRFYIDNYFLNNAHWYLSRFVFIIFAYLLSEGMTYTKNRFKYIFSLFLFAVISEIPYDLAFENKAICMKEQNVLFTLGFSGLAICIYDKFENKRFFQILGVFICISVAVLLRADYSIQGISITLLFYIFKGNKKKQIISFVIAWIITLPLSYIINNLYANMPIKEIFSYEVFQYYLKEYISDLHAFVSIPLLLLYKGRKGLTRNKWIFYIFYPTHLILIYVVLTIICCIIK